MSNKVKKILWAVDAFTEDTALQLKLANQLKLWTKSASRVEIEPVTILSPDQLGMTVDLFVQQIKNVEERATENIEKVSQKLKIAGMLPPRVLFSNTVSLRQAIQVFLDYARRSHADVIAVGTQSRKGVTHFLFGSFAETLILHSDIPIFIINPKLHNLKKQNSILFATDFSPLSEKAFDRVLEMAKERKMSVTVFNRVEYVTEYTLPSLSAPAYEMYRKNDTAERQKSLIRLVSIAKEKGVKADWVLDEKSGKPPFDAITSTAKKLRVGMIAMAAQTGPVASVILGSTTRQVLRYAGCPIWVIHMRKEREVSATTSRVTGKVVNL